MLFPRALIEDALGPVVSASIAHYTRIGTLGCFLRPGTKDWSSARSSPIQFLNDRMELDLGLQVLREVARRKPASGARVQGIIEDLLNQPGRLSTDAFQMSFSGDPDELGQWRGYASNGMGCSVVTDAIAVKNVADVAGWVIYKERDQRAFAYKVLAKLRKERDLSFIQQVLVAAASYMKHPGFESEKEFRLLQLPASSQVEFKETVNRLVPFFDFLGGVRALPISQIFVGPGWQLRRLKPEEFGRNHVVEGIRRLLEARSMIVDVLPSEIPYDPQ